MSEKEKEYMRREAVRFVKQIIRDGASDGIVIKKFTNFGYSKTTADSCLEEAKLEILKKQGEVK
jgi:hypothetical protein